MTNKLLWIEKSCFPPKMVIISKIFWGALTLYRSAQLRKPTKFWKLFSNHPIIAGSKVPVFFLLSAFNLWLVVGRDTCWRWAPKREKKKISYFIAHHTNEAILPIYIIHIANFNNATTHIDIIRKWSIRQNITQKKTTNFDGKLLSQKPGSSRDQHWSWLTIYS